MEIEKDEKRYYKLKLCNLYEKNGKCYRGDNCNYAHGKDDLKEFKKICNFGLKCFNKDCHFFHPGGWSPENNKKICEYYINGYCINDDNCKFKHIEEKNEFPYLKENHQNDIKVNKNININDYIKNIIKNHLHEDIIYNIIENIRNNNNIIPIENDIEIFVDGVKYNDKLNDIENNIEDIKINENKDINKNEDNHSREILTNNINYNYIYDDNKENIEELISKLQNDFEKYTKEIKNNIDNIFIESKQKYRYNIKMDLNKIMAEISLFKNNYQDIINHYNN